MKNPIDSTVWDAIEQMMDPANIERVEKEQPKRAAFILRLFKTFRERDTSLAKHYVETTWEIPLFFLGASVIALERTRVFPSLPTPGELWLTAKLCAGMHRQRYEAGRYLPAPKTWPPSGQRYAITTGEFERLSRDPTLLLAAGEVEQLVASRQPELIE